MLTKYAKVLDIEPDTGCKDAYTEKFFWPRELVSFEWRSIRLKMSCTWENFAFFKKCLKLETLLCWKLCFQGICCDVLVLIRTNTSQQRRLEWLQSVVNLFLQPLLYSLFLVELSCLIIYIKVTKSELGVNVALWTWSNSSESKQSEAVRKNHRTEL